MRNRKLFLFMLAVVLLVLSACSEDEKSKSKEKDGGTSEEINETGMPIVEEKITLNFFAGQSEFTAKDWNDVMIFNEYEEMTNIDINWEMVPRMSLAEKRGLKLVSNELPDAFHTAGVPATDILKYGKEGIFIPLNDLIDQYAPNLKSYLEKYPDIKKGITFPDGNIYSFPFIKNPEFLSHHYGAKPFINEEWLEKLELDIPETTEEFYEYLKAVKEGDPNGNGEADEIPFGIGDISMLVNYLTGSFGVANMGQANQNLDVDPKTKEIRFYPTTDNYKELLMYLNKLYKEELIQKNVFSLENDQYLANFSEGVYGGTVDWGPSHRIGEAGDPFVGMPALKGPNGDQLYTDYYPSVATLGAFLITNANKHPAATVRWIDYFYSDEGMKLFFLGLEGKTFEEMADGEFDYMDHIKNSKDGLSMEQEIAKYLTFSGGMHPSVSTQEFFKGSESSKQSLEALEVLKPYLLENPWQTFIYTEDEYKGLATYGADINKYAKEMRDKFISGDLPFSEWDKYIKTLESMGMEKYMKIQADAYDRYKNN